MTRKPRKVVRASNFGFAPPIHPSKTIYYEGERLTALLKRLEGEIESTKLLKGPLPEKIWTKQQFSIGVNDVTRVLERMPISVGTLSQEPPLIHRGHIPSSVQLQAVLVALDCNPRRLTNHLLSLASSRRVPLIYVKDNREGSLRLGELFKLKTAIAVGVKARGSSINKTIEEVICTNESSGGVEPSEVR